MFFTTPQALCYLCHGDMERVVKGSKFQHQPVGDGECASCHNPHGALFKDLLRNFYPEEFYVPYRQDNYALCLECHSPNTLEYQRTSEATDFRNGDRNLHFIHVNKNDKGRVCKTCHGVHGANQKRLILPKVPDFGRWQIPIEFTPTSTGGTCVVGCHKPKSYDRLRPVNNL